MIDLLFRGRSLVFDSPLSRDEIAARLQREISAPVWRVRDERTQLFVGEFAGDRFRMARLVHGRNSVRPVIEGRLSSGARGTRIDVKLRLHPGVLIFFGIFFTIGGSVAALSAREFLAGPPAPAPYFGMVVPVMVMCIFLLGAIGEARKATRLLAAVFASEPSRPDGVSCAPHIR